MTKKWINAFIKNPKATTIIETEDDLRAGEQTCRFLYKELTKSESIPYFSINNGDKKSIGVDDIRELKKYLSLKADIDGKYTRFVVIQSAELLTSEAQNALLKIIEELPARTILLLIVNDKSKMLDTIDSRCFRIKILPIEFSKAEEYANKKGVDKTLFKRAYLMSEGRISEFNNLIEGDSTDIESILSLVKRFISSDIYKRQKILQEYTKANFDDKSFVKYLQLISKTSMRATKKNEDKQKWKRILEKSIQAENQLNNNVSAKLTLLSLSVSI